LVLAAWAFSLRNDQARSERSGRAVGVLSSVVGDKAGVSAQHRYGFELFGADSEISTLNKIRRALEAACVRFIDEDEQDGLGVRLQKGKPAGKRM
jgi:hypothetical protein